MAAQVPQCFRKRPHPPNKPLHLYQIRIILRVVLTMSVIGQLNKAFSAHATLDNRKPAIRYFHARDWRVHIYETANSLPRRRL